MPIIRESGAPCQRPAQTAGDRGGAPCSLPYSGGNNPRDSASKQASAHHNSRATSTRTATHAYHHHTTHAGCQSTGVGWPTRVNPHGRKKTRAQTARARPKPEVKRRGKPDRESGHVGTGGTLAAMRRGLDRERLEPTQNLFKIFVLKIFHIIHAFHTEPVARGRCSTREPQSSSHRSASCRRSLYDYLLIRADLLTTARLLPYEAARPLATTRWSAAWERTSPTP